MLKKISAFHGLQVRSEEVRLATVEHRVNDHVVTLDLLVKFVDLIDDGQLVRGSVADQLSTQDKLSVFPPLANDGELAFNVGFFLGHLDYTVNCTFEGWLVKAIERFDLKAVFWTLLAFASFFKESTHARLRQE